MDLKKYKEMPNSDVPIEIIEKLKISGGITKTLFENKDDILTNENLHFDCGYSLMDDNYYLVSMYTPMPNVTKEMVAWWFWWHAQESERYQAWYPGEHKGISYARKDKAYFSQKQTPKFQANTQYPVECVGSFAMPLSIDFVSPKEFGFDESITKDNDVEIIICGHVGAFKGLVPNTEMSHIFFKKDDGLLLVSRFWLGKNVTNKFLKKLFVTEKQAKDMAYHCCVEYRNFSRKIPLMYHEWLSENS